MQQQNDGTHAILPVATHLTCNVDHAGVPVMWLRHADGKLRRDGFPAALLQRPCAVDERGRVHGAPGLAVVVAHRVQARRRGPCRKRERKREWLRWYATNDRLRGQDKSRKVRPVGWGRNSAKFRPIRNIARLSRNLRFSATHDRPTNFYTLWCER